MRDFGDIRHGNTFSAPKSKSRSIHFTKSSQDCNYKLSTRWSLSLPVLTTFLSVCVWIWSLISSLVTVFSFLTFGKLILGCGRLIDFVSFTHYPWIWILTEISWLGTLDTFLAFDDYDIVITRLNVWYWNMLKRASTFGSSLWGALSLYRVSY